jgi:predicted nucleic acid-binding protein
MLDPEAVGSALIDTTVIVYAHDPGDLEKMAIAQEWLEGLHSAGGHLSCQILGEFFRVVTARLSPRMEPSEAVAQIENLVLSFPVLNITPGICIAAARGTLEHGMSYWDAQVWATALLNQLTTVISEDFQSGRVVEGVAFVNPFAGLRPGV